MRDLIPLSPARLCNKIDVGDIVVAVDDKDVDTSKVLEALRGCDKVGSECQITLKNRKVQDPEAQANMPQTIKDTRIVWESILLDSYEVQAYHRFSVPAAFGSQL